MRTAHSRWLLSALLLFGVLSSASAFAQTLYPKDQQVFWVRNGVSFALANGVRDNVAGVAPTATTRDTSGAFDVRDHWTAFARVMRSVNGGVAGSLVQDTTGTFGTLTLRSTKNSLDSISIVRQWSSDGSRWNTVDSIGGHFVNADSLISASSAATDSVRALNGVVTSGASRVTGIAQRVVNYTWNCHPLYTADQVTSLATNGINFIRFIVTMSHGDYVGAGLTDGWTGEFRYVAIKEHQ